MKAFINLAPGVVVESDGERYVVISILTIETVLAKDVEKTGKHRELRIQDIIPVANLTSDEEEKQPDLSLISEPDWSQASWWADRLRKLLSVSRCTTEMVDEVARDANVSRATVYRNLKKFKQLGKSSSLVAKKSDGGKGKSRLAPEVEAIIRSTILDLLFTKGKKKHSIEDVYEEIKRKLEHAKLKIPHIITVQRRIQSIRKEIESDRQSAGQESGKRNIAYPGHFPGEKLICKCSPAEDSVSYPLVLPTYFDESLLSILICVSV